MASAASVLEMALESCAFDDCADIERIELPEIDCALLTALLEESQAAEDGDINMAGSPCSAPQPPAETAAPISDGLHGDRGDCGLEGVLSLLDSSASSCMHVDDDSCWVDMDVVVPSSPSDDMGEWFMGTGDVGMVGYELDSEEFYHHHLYSYYGGDVTVEDGCSTPLWQMSY